MASGAMTGLLEDVQFAVRTLLRGGRFTVSAVLTLALVLGTNAAVFSLFYSVLLRPIEVSELDRLVLVDLPRGDQRAVGVPTRVFLDWKKESRSFAGLAGYDLSLALVGGAEGPAETRLGADVTPDFFSVVGGKVALGRTLAADEVAGKKESTVVISHALWQGRFGGDPAVVGKQLLISATKFTIVGVMAAGFAFPLQVDLWYPGTQDAGDATRAFGRLAPGVTLAAAEAELQAIHERLKRLHPRLDQQAAPRLEPLRNLDLTGARSILATVLAGSIFLLLVGCANLATQLLARSLHRRKEIATRISIGASRARIIRQLLTEAVLLALLGAGLGLLVAHWLIDLSKYLFSSLGFLPGFRAAGLSATTCGYLAAVAVAAGVLFGLAPALQLARTDIHDALKDSGRGHTGTRRARRLRDGLIVAQVALAVLVAFGAVSFGSLLERVLAKKGFDPTNVTAASLQLSPSRSESPAA
jgi:putative ABC transport system permease protein